MRCKSQSDRCWKWHRFAQFGLKAKLPYHPSHPTKTNEEHLLPLAGDFDPLQYKYWSELVKHPTLVGTVGLVEASKCHTLYPPHLPEY